VIPEFFYKPMYDSRHRFRLIPSDSAKPCSSGFILRSQLRLPVAKGEIAALSGAQDNARCFRISVPVQPGNSGGLSLLESVPEVAAKLKEPSAKERKFEEVVKSAELSAVPVLVYSR